MVAAAFLKLYLRSEDLFTTVLDCCLVTAFPKNSGVYRRFGHHATVMKNKSVIVLNPLLDKELELDCANLNL